MTQKQWNEFSSFLRDSLQLTEKQKEILSEKKKELSTFIKTTKTKKDPSLPSRPSSSYIFFSTENRERIRKENPDLKNSDIMKKMGEEWKGLSDEEKQPHIDKANLDKERFRKETESSGVGEKKKESKKKDSTKKPTSYQIFQSRERPLIKKQNPTLKGSEISKELSSRWKKLTDEQKEAFSKEDDVQVSETKVSETKVSQKASQTKVSETKPDSKKTKTKTDEQRPVKKPTKHVDTEGFKCFLEENDDKDRNEVEKMWNALSKKKRDAYEEEACLGKSDDEELLEEDN